MAQIKKDTSLRKAILQAAITGQLISNVEETTESGKQLLDRIIEERNEKALAEWKEILKKNPKAKKPAQIVASLQYDQDGRLLSEVEVPFEIPENWCWCRLGDIILLLSGQDFPPEKYSDVEESVPYITGASNIEDNHVIINRWTKFPTVISKKNDILLVCKGSGYGKVVIADFDQAHIARQIMAIRASDSTLRKWIFLFLQNKFSYFKTQGNGLIPGIARNVVLDLLIPLPPLAVQNAIVAKLEQVLPLVDTYENAVLQKEELKNALPDKVKKAILQEAITGQLTEAWRKSASIKESGKQLLDRIIEERNAKALVEWEEALKKNPKAKKPVSVVANEIEEDEIPFEVPESWCWCHLGEICNEIKRGKSPKYVDRSDYLAFAQKCNVKTGGIDLSLALYLDEKSIDRYSEEDNLIQGDVVINSTGGGTMGRVGYYETKVPEGIKGVYPDSHVTVIRSIGNINQRYLYYILKNNQPVLEDCGTGSTNQTELKPGVLANFVIPLPPLEEQEEIVKKVEELLPLCK